MRAALLLSLLCGSAFADGGSISCPTDHTVDTVSTTVWKAKVTKVRRNGVVVTTGTYQSINEPGSHPISDFGDIRLSSNTFSMTRPWADIFLYGGGFYPLSLSSR